MVVIGNDESRVRCPSALTGTLSDLGEAVPDGLCGATVVLPEELREICGLAKASLARDPGMVPSFLGRGESFRTDRLDGVLPPPEPVLLIASAAAVDSDPGTGDGADEPFAAVTLRIWART